MTCVSLCASGRWRVFTGNELGALLGWWMFRCWKDQNCDDAAAVKNLYMLSSTVSSKILRAIALKEGFHYEVTVFIVCSSGRFTAAAVSNHT